MSVGAVNKQTGDRIPTAGMPAVDSVLSGSSTNPVQNRVVKAALDDKADTDMVAADFDATASYTAGNYCIYDGKFYKFKNNHSGAWSEADVDEIKIAGELSALKSGLTNIDDELLVYHKRYNGGDLWDGDTLTFNNIKASSNIVYHFIAFNSGASGTPESAYLIVKATGVQTYGKVGTFTTAYDAEHETLTITLPSSTYWDYRFEVAARRNG